VLPPKSSPAPSSQLLPRRSIVLPGLSPNYGPYAAPVLRSSPFSLYFDTASKEEVIAHGKPHAGATQIFRPRRDEFGQTTLSYGLITVIPSQTAGGKNEQTVIFSDCRQWRRPRGYIL
jgi:hypothetical protein